MVVYKAGNGGITIAGGATDYGSIYFADGAGGGSNHQGAVQYHHGSDKLYLGAGGTDNHLTLDSTGNFGVGTTSPQSKLDVEGGVSIGAGYEVSETVDLTGTLSYLGFNTIDITDDGVLTQVLDSDTLAFRIGARFKF